MEAPISASQGAMRSLPGKLKSLLEPPGHGLTKGEKNKIHLLKGDLEELIIKANYLMEPSEVDAPALPLTGNCWVKEVRELSYDIDDFVKELVHVDADAKIEAVEKTPCVKITRLRENLNRRRWIADEISGFSTRVKEVINLYKNYNLGSRRSFRPWRTSDEHPPPPLVHRDDLWVKLHGWLTDDGEQQQRVASIVGLGGVGKTTLAKQVYDKLGGRFECRAFVRTSRKADMRRLLTSMLSQLRRHEPPEADAWEVHHLIDKIRAHLIHKKYFIIIDDLWATSTWDIVSRALPDNPCSRILLTTEFDIVAQMCCGYNSKYIFKMEPLSEDESRELFFSRAFGHQHDCPEQLNEVSFDIIQKCGGLPLATITVASLLASQPNRIDQWRYIQNSLSSNLRADPTLEGMQQVLNVSYNNLPHRLKACMLYLCMYRESHIIWKNDLVKQWTAEDFISVVEGEDMEEIAGSYFDELVERGMIQPVDINYNGEVLSCAVHYIVLNFIRYKSIEENFVTAIDHSQTNVRLTNKVRRLSLYFGDAEDVTTPSLRLSQVRSVGFFGLFKCMPSILEFNLLQVLILQLWGDDYESYNFTEISKLFRLRYLRINAFHLSVRLPTQMQRLKDLVTLEIERRVTAVPSDIVDLPRLLHLSLPSETALPNGIGRMTSLRTLGYFNLSSNSKENVLNLGELTNLCDLRLTCSTVPSDNQENNMLCLSTILSKLSRLKSLTLAPEFSHTKTPNASVSSMSISCDGLGSVSSPPTLLQRLELLPRICIFPSLPEWIRKLDRLSILKIAVRGLSMNDIDILKELLALTSVSLYVRTAPVKRIVFDKAGFPNLRYLKFMCTAPCLAFEEGAMPKVRRLKLGSNAHGAEQYGPVLSSIKYLLSLEEITLLIGGSNRTAAKLVLRDAISKHPSTPIVNIQYVDWIFYCEEEKIRATQEQEQPYLENQYENVEVDSDRHEIIETNTGKENVEVDSDRHEIIETNTGKDTSNQADCRISMSSESTSHLPSPEVKAVVLDAFASYLQNMLTEMASEEVDMLLGISGEIDNLGAKLGDLKNFLADAERRSITDQSVQGWVRELKDAMYDATDILDLCQLKAMDQRGASIDLGCCNPLLFCLWNPLCANDIGSRIKALNKRLDRIKERSAAFNFVNLGSYEERSSRVHAASHPVASHVTMGEPVQSGVVGEKIREDTRELVEMLAEKECNSNIMVVAIVGVGGIGKTTLAREVFNDDTIKDKFDKRIWLSINYDFDKAKLLRTAITHAGGDHRGEKARAVLWPALTAALTGKKLLLVMDDVWSHGAWEDVLETPLVNAVAPGSRVLVTTRDERVARGMKAKEPYHHVDKLGPEDAWSLLKMQIVSSEVHEPTVDMLKDIGLEIIARCGGLPLAVKVMGGLLCKREKRQGDWEKVLNDSIWSVPEMPQELFYAIYLSYEDLPPYMKQCFLHFSLLPKNTDFGIDTVVSMWISEGFLHENSDELEELGSDCYKELISRNLIEPDTMILERPVCNMHDVVRSFAQYVARDDALVAHSGETDSISKLSSHKFHRLSIEIEGSESDEFDWSFLHAQESLRTLISIGHLKIKPGDSLVPFSRLRTLHLESADVAALVESVCQLKHLRYMGLRYTNISRLPKNINKMKFLQYISLRGCESLVKLPNGIVKLGQLRYLSLVDTSIKGVPRGFHGLTNLRKLRGFLAHMDGDWCSLEELGPLSKLRLLGLTGLENVSTASSAAKARLGEKVHLNRLYLLCRSRLGDDGLVKQEVGVSQEEQRRIEEVFDELCPAPCLDYLNIEGYFGRRLPMWMLRTAAEVTLKSLRFLMMEDLAFCTQLPNGLCQLPCLQFLRIYRASAIERVGSEFLQQLYHHHSHNPSFPRLRTMNLIEMVEWEEWEWEEQVEAMPILEELLIDGCKLRRVPPGLAFHARALKRLHVRYVRHLNSLNNFASLVELYVHRNPDLERITSLPKLKKLHIKHCPKLKVLDGMPALQRLELLDFDMETLPGYLRDVNPRHLELDCSLELLTSIAVGQSITEWERLSHIQQVKAYADDGDNERKWYALYTGDAYNLETNIVVSSSTGGGSLAGLVDLPLEAME